MPSACLTAIPPSWLHAAHPSRFNSNITFPSSTSWSTISPTGIRFPLWWLCNLSACLGWTTFPRLDFIIIFNVSGEGMHRKILRRGEELRGSDCHCCWWAGPVTALPSCDPPWVSVTSGPGRQVYLHLQGHHSRSNKKQLTCSSPSLKASSLGFWVLACPWSPPLSHLTTIFFLDCLACGHQL